MSRERRRILAVVGVVIAAVAAFVLSRVLTTIVLAIAAGYMLLPLHRWFVGHGMPAYWCAIVTTVVGVILSLALLAPFAFVLYIRRDALIDVITGLEGAVLLTLAGGTYVLDITGIQKVITRTSPDWRSLSAASYRFCRRSSSSTRSSCSHCCTTTDIFVR